MSGNIYQMLIEEHAQGVMNSSIKISLAQYIEQEMQAVKNIEAELRRIRYRDETTQTKFKDAMSAIASEIGAVQERCKHRVASYNGDPAGGNDSFHSCDHCGAQW